MQVTRCPYAAGRPGDAKYGMQMHTGTDATLQAAHGRVPTFAPCCCRLLSGAASLPSAEDMAAANKQWAAQRQQQGLRPEHRWGWAVCCRHTLYKAWWSAALFNNSTRQHGVSRLHGCRRCCCLGSNCAVPPPHRALKQTAPALARPAHTTATASTTASWHTTGGWQHSVALMCRSSRPGGRMCCMASSRCGGC
jgi:hypothetical protein